MFPLFKKREKPGKEIILTIDGMHCTSCAMNIDGALEDLEGVFCAETSYSKGEVKVEFDPHKTDIEAVIKTIQQEGYEVNRGKNT